MISLFHFFLELFSHYIFLNFSCYCQRKLCHEFNISRYFVMGYGTFAMVYYLISSYFVVLQILYFYHCSYLLSVFLIWNSNNLHIEHTFHFIKKILYLFWIYVLSSSNYHVFFSSNYREKSLFIYNSHIATFHPTVLNRFLSSLFITPIF